MKNVAPRARDDGQREFVRVMTFACWYCATRMPDTLERTRSPMEGTWIDWLGFAVTGAIAFHGLTYRDANGEHPWVHLLFGAIALMFAMRFLLADILAIW